MAEKEKFLAEKLRDLAREADEKAQSMIGVDDAKDSYYQGERNAFNKAADLTEKEQKRRAQKIKKISMELDRCEIILGRLEKLLFKKNGDV